MSLVLASESATRRRLLAAAGLVFDAITPKLDEESVKDALKAEGASPGEAALTLAEMKAKKISQQRPGAFVIGCDQLLSCQGQWFDKPADRLAAAAQLSVLAGRSHDLHTAVFVVRDGQSLWHHLDISHVTLRALADHEIETYLSRAAEAVLGSVGAYQIEGLGVTLMTKVEGDIFAIQGLPLLPLLSFLREHELVP